MRANRTAAAVAALLALTACSPSGSSHAPSSTARPSPATTSPLPSATVSSPTARSRSTSRVRTTSRPASSSAPSKPTPTPTPLSARARAAGLIDIRTVVPDAIVDLRYRSSDNFTKVRLYPLDARCLVHRSMAPGLVTAARQLRRAGNLLVFWDCYRPHAVQERMFRIVPDPDWVARPGPYATSHEAGRSVDVTLARADPESRCAPERRVQGHCLLAMGTGFDDFTPRAYAYATAGVSTAAQANRARLRTAMAAGGIRVYRGEWWHFDGPGALTQRPHLHAPLS